MFIHTQERGVYRVSVNFTGQTAKADYLRPLLVQFKGEMDLFEPLWNQLSEGQKRRVVRNKEFGPLFDLFVDVVKYSSKWSIEDVS